MHLELITATATAPGSSGAAATAVAGDSLVIKNSKSAGTLLSVWGQNHADGWLQIVKPSGHDTTRGWRQVVDSANIMNLLAAGISLDVEPQETLTASIAGSATAGQVEVACMQVFYEDLPGVEGRFVDWAKVVEIGEWLKLNTIQANLVGAAAGYTGQTLINAQSDLLQANRDYAVLGITTNVPVAAVYITGPDTAYQKAAVPGGVSEADYGRDWFCTLSRAFNAPLIPVINSGNKNSTYFGFVQNESNVNPQVSMSLCLLPKDWEQQ
jgi:hypothetical protein